MPVPTITSVTPSVGPLTGGATVTIVGVGFTGTTGATGVTFDAVNATSYVVTDDTHLSVVVPTLTAGVHDVIVTNGTGPSIATAGDHYTAEAVPTVTALSISTDDPAGGTAVTLTGTGFSDVTAVKFGTTSAAFTITNSTHIAATAPAHAAGSTNVTVVSPGGTSATGAGNAWTWAVVAPVVTSVSVASGTPNGGTSVVLTGTGFGSATAVKFATTDATSFTITNATHITAVSPVHAAGATHITVVNPGGTSATAAGNVWTYVVHATGTYVQVDGDNEGMTYFMDEQLTPAALASGELVKRLDPIVYPQKNILHGKTQGTDSAAEDAPAPAFG